MYSDKIAIIGAGFCGLGVAAALQRHAIAFDCLEADDAIGGNWYHGVYETVHIISSRKTTEYSDYPMPADFPDFPSAAQMLAYLHSYADHYGLRDHIQLNTRVARVAPAPSDRWALTLESGETRVYAGVVIANGHHWDSRYPDYPGDFGGVVMHSKDYKNPQSLAGKRVLVVGGGNSACDIAVEAARFARASHISMRRGYWFLPRTMFGIPTVECLKPWMPLWFQRLFLRAVLRIIVGPYENYGLQRPDHKIFEKHPTINSDLLAYLKHGRITPHPDIGRFDGEEVIFVDGRRAAVDMIIYATGYHLSFPFLEPGIVEWKEGVPQLISMFHPRYKNIYFFGIGQARYGAGPLISAGADLLGVLIKEQRRLKHPIGAILQRLGQRPPKTMLTGPFEVLRGVQRGRRLAPRLATLERLLLR